MKHIKNKKILIAPLNWGLGHATRSLALAKKLVQNGNSIVLAGNLAAKKVFDAGNISFDFVEYNGYEITYNNHIPLWLSAGLSLLKKLPHILKEQKMAEVIVEEYGIDLLISDHRLGFFSKKIPSYFLAHQIEIKLPYFLISINLIQRYIINQYQELWIPDNENINLSGSLSNIKGIKIPVKFIGFLSQFENYSQQNEKLYHVLALLSGPEPQRSIFEKKILKEVANKPDLRFALVRGINSSVDFEFEKLKNLKVCNFIAGDQLAKLINESDYILGRGGYTSLMDFFTLGGMRLLIVPTPGQTEQEYLAENLKKKGLAVVQRQKQFNLNLFLSMAKNLPKIKKALSSV